jgi:hypothetical protein
MSTLTDFRGLPLPTHGSSATKEKVFVDHRRFGKGSLHEFSWYFEGESAVDTLCMEDVLGWLRNCEYVPDETLFREDDFWQHPITFESMRKGDCADHALWAWRKMTELGYDAEFTSGKVKRSATGEIQPDGQGHAWVVFREKGCNTWKLMEATEKNPERIIRDLAETALSYFPKFSVSGDLQTFRHFLS